MTIPAYFEREAAVTDRREPRRTLLLEARGTSAAGHATEVVIHNISVTGLLIECAAELKHGETMEIELPDAGRTLATIVWTSGRLFGCEFREPISTAAVDAAMSRSISDETDFTPPAVPTETFAARLQRLRKAQGLTLAEVAAQLDVSKPTVWAWEKGRARPLDDRLEDLAHVLGVPSADLVSGQDSEALHGLIAHCRDEIGRACGANPQKVRIFVEL